MGKIKKNIRRVIQLALLPYSLLFGHYYATETFAYEQKSIKLLIDPGHNEKFVGQNGKAGLEHIIVLEAAKHLEEFLRQDRGFDVELTRTGGYYSLPIATFKREHEKTLVELLKKPIARASTNPERAKELYAIIMYAESTGKDAIVSLHLDSHTTDFGYHIIISPLNKMYDKSKALAVSISQQLSTKRNPNRSIANGKHAYMPEDEKNDLISNGIVARKLIVLGDDRHATSVASVLIEMGNVNDPKFKNEKFLEETAVLIYRGIRNNFYNGIILGK